MKKKALLISLIALAMALCMFAGATIAYLFVVSQDVVNTFSPSNITLELEETDADNDTDANKNEYQMIPGATIIKDPKVSASASLELSALPILTAPAASQVATSLPTTVTPQTSVAYTS